MKLLRDIFNAVFPTFAINPKRELIRKLFLVDSTSLPLVPSGKGDVYHQIVPGKTRGNHRMKKVNRLHVSRAARARHKRRNRP